MNRPSHVGSFHTTASCSWNKYPACNSSELAAPTRIKKYKIASIVSQFAHNLALEFLTTANIRKHFYRMGHSK